MPVLKVCKNHQNSGGKRKDDLPEVFDLYYELHGSGPHQVLLIGGFGNICHQWDYQVEYFGKLPDFTVCIFDNRGAGFSGVPQGRYRTSDMAGDAKMLLDHLGWDRVHVVGVSMGGMIAQELAHLCRKRIVSLTLESTYGYFNGLPRAGVKGMVSGGPKERTLENFVRHFMKVLFPKEWLDAPSDDPKFGTNADRVLAFGMERYAKTGLQDPAGRANQQNACLTHYMSPTRLNQIRDAGFPILVWTGDKDDIVIQPASSEYLAQHLGAKLEIWSGFGHAMRLQCPQRHNEFLEAFIRDAIVKDEAKRRDFAAAARAAGAVGSTAMFAGTSRWWSQLEENFLSHAAAISSTRWIEIHRTSVEVIDILPRQSLTSQRSVPASPMLAPSTPELLHNHSMTTMTTSSSSVSISQLLSFSSSETPENDSFAGIENIPKIDLNANQSADDEDDEGQENPQAAARRGFLPRFLPSLGGIRFGFTDFVSMLSNGP